MNEETITETVLYEIALRHKKGNYLAVPYSKQEESKNGADWLWWFVRAKQAVSYRVQAKRLFPSGRYESLFSSGTDPEKQLKKLVLRAKQGGHTPLYCLYNFDHLPANFSMPGIACSHNYRAPSYWGCALILPEDIQLVASDHVTDLRPFMVPWHVLACVKGGKTLPQAAAHASQILSMPKTYWVGRQKKESPSRNISSELRAVPQYVEELRNREFSESDSSEKVPDQIRAVLEEEDLGGIVLFDDRRQT